MKISYAFYTQIEIDMTRLSSLRQSLEDMSLDELREYVRQTRADRKISKASTKAPKARAKRAAKSTTDKAIDKMSAEQLAILLGELEDEGSGSSN